MPPQRSRFNRAGPTLTPEMRPPVRQSGFRSIHHGLIPPVGFDEMDDDAGGHFRRGPTLLHRGLREAGGGEVPAGRAERAPPAGPDVHRNRSQARRTIPALRPRLACSGRVRPGTASRRDETKDFAWPTHWPAGTALARVLDKQEPCLTLPPSQYGPRTGE